MAKNKRHRLIGALRTLDTAISNYLDDTEESGCDNYDLERLVPIPKEEPDGYDADASEEPEPEDLAWEIKLAVIAVQRVYAALGIGEPGPAGEGNLLPDDGLKLWRRLLAASRAKKSGASIYNAACDFRSWVEEEIRRQKGAADAPPDPTAYVLISKRFRDYYASQKACMLDLKDYFIPWEDGQTVGKIRTWKPSRQRRAVHAVDWDRFFELRNRDDVFAIMDEYDEDSGKRQEKLREEKCRTGK